MTTKIVGEKKKTARICDHKQRQISSKINSKSYIQAVSRETDIVPRYLCFSFVIYNTDKAQCSILKNQIKSHLACSRPLLDQAGDKLFIIL